MSRKQYKNVVVSQGGDALTGAQVEVRDTAGSLVTLYEADSGATQAYSGANPFSAGDGTTEPVGEFSFWVEVPVEIVITAGASPTDYVLREILIDPVDALMESELSDVAAVKALDQGVATTDTVSFTAVGIGIASPAEELHVAASGSLGAAALFTNGNTGSTATDGLFVGYSDQAYIYNYENTDLDFATNDTTRMTLKADGKVGIGTDAPVGPMHLRTVNNAGLFVSTSDGSAPTSGSSLWLQNQGSGEGIGNGLQAVYSNAAYFWNYENTLMQFSTNNTPRMTIAADGKVGIGTASPANALDVVGNVDITGELAATSAVTTATAPVAGVYATYAAAEAATIPAAVTSLKVRRGGDIIEYVRDATGTALTTAGSINWSPVKVDGAYPVVAWNPPVDGVTNDSTAVQAAFDWCVAEGEPFALHFMPGSWTFTSGVDCTAATEAFEMRGHREMVNMVATGYGADSYMFDVPGTVKSTWSGFTFGSGSGALKNHPIALNLREGGRTTIRDITGAAHGNTILFSTRPFNADWDSLDLFFCGWQPLHKDVDASTITLSDDGSFADRVTASAAVFDAGDVGKDIYVYHDTSANEATVYRITAYNSTTSVTLDRDRDKTLSAAKFSFDQIRAVVTGTTVVFDRDIGMEAADVGRMIYIDRAGADGKTHVDQIASVTAGDEIELENAVTTNGTYRIFFTPSVYIGSHDIVGTGPNDICIDRMLIEGFAGPALMIDGGLHIKIGEMKTHGRAWGDFSNFGQSAEALIWNAAHKSRIENWEMEFCGHMQDSATVRVAGDAPGLSIGYLSHNAPLVGGYLFDVEFTDTEKSYLGLPAINGRSNLDLYDGILLSSSNSVARRVNFQRIGGASRAIESSRQGPQMIGSVRSLSPWSLANGASVTFTTPTVAGVVSVTANDTPNFAGVFSFYTNGCALLAGSNASATLSTASSLNVDCSSGELTIENNTGATRRFYVGMLG